MNRIDRFIPIALTLWLAAGPAEAGIDLTWDGCSDGTGVRTTVFDCDAGGTRDLVGTFHLPVEMPHFIGIQGAIVMTIEGSFDAQPFWQYESGGCNAPNLAFGSFGPPMAGCAPESDPWSSPDVFPPLLDFKRSSSRARIDFAVAHPVPRGTPLLAEAPYLAFRLRFDLAGAASCGGCTSGAVFYLEQFDVASNSAPAQYLQKDGSQATCAFLNGATEALCGVVPVRNRTWGSIKSLYR